MNRIGSERLAVSYRSVIKLDHNSRERFQHCAEQTDEYMLWNNMLSELLKYICEQSGFELYLILNSEFTHIRLSEKEKNSMNLVLVGEVRHYA